MDDIKKIKIKYIPNQNGEKVTTLEKIQKGDWIDLRAAKDMTIHKGEFALIPLGVAMELPEGYEAIIAPRSSTFKNFKIIQTNSVGCVDHSYCGDSDQWFFPAYAMEDTEIKMNDRICQFRIFPNQPQIDFETYETLGNEDRGGHGSTGRN